MVESRAGRTYTDEENFTYFIGELSKDDRYTAVIEEAHKACRVDDPIPNKYKIDRIHRTLLRYRNNTTDGDLNALHPNAQQFQISTMEANKKPTTTIENTPT